MKQMWQLGIKLEDSRVFSMIEKLCNFSIPEEIKNFILENNGASPKNYKFNVGNQTEVFGAVLNFNKDSGEGSGAFDALNIVGKCKLLPFGIDPFGNYICCDCETKRIVFWEHEQSNKGIEIANDIDSFINGLF